VTRARTLWRAAGVAAVVIAVDQVAKAVVRDAIGRGDRHELLPFLDLVNVRNTGVAFGVLAGGGALIVVGTAIALLALLVFVLGHSGRPLVWLPAGLLLGGAVGNLIDRVREGSVTDFVKLPSWPAFNVADMAITVGVLVLLYVLEGPPRRRELAARERAEAAPDGG
jgi:signal peptidase II